MKVRCRGRRPFRLWQVTSRDVRLRSGYRCDVHTTGRGLFWTVRNHLSILRYHRRGRR